MNEAKINIYLSQETDLQDIIIHHLCKLVNEAYEKGEFDMWKENIQRIDFQSMFKIIQNKSLFIAQIMNQIVGCIKINCINDKIAEFGMLATDEKYQNKGIGKNLIKTAETWAKSNNHTIMQLEILTPRNWVHPNKEFLKIWYTKMGYIYQSTLDVKKSYPELALDLKTECDFLIYQKLL
ncbi:MAG: GNAT family N-acetyltransferase [Alphaproteobacteria bacterium]|nr:GNAT family N-acetyltransferase [Alphaproteobacteria bacterium]